MLNPVYLLSSDRKTFGTYVVTFVDPATYEGGCKGPGKTNHTACNTLITAIN